MFEFRFWLYGVRFAVRSMFSRLWSTMLDLDFRHSLPLFRVLFFDSRFAKFDFSLRTSDFRFLGFVCRRSIIGIRCLIFDFRFLTVELRLYFLSLALGILNVRISLDSLIL